jgi:hypothetical protein
VVGGRRRRKTAWAIWCWTAFCALVISVRVTDRTPATCQPGDRLCRYVRDAETHFGTSKMVLFWLLGLSGLSLIVLLTRRQRHGCPRCGFDLAKTQTKCRLCGYDSTIGVPLATALSPVVAARGTKAAPSTRLELWDPVGADPGDGSLVVRRQTVPGALRGPGQLRESREQPRADPAG